MRTGTVLARPGITADQATLLARLAPASAHAAAAALAEVRLPAGSAAMERGQDRNHTPKRDTLENLKQRLRDGIAAENKTQNDP